MSGSSETTASSRTKVAAICGNPNSGKTTIFNALTGLRQKVGNYSGVTVERVSGQFYLQGETKESCTILDIPGSYSLASFSPDEYIAAQALFGNTPEGNKPDVLLCVLDATSLERGLYLLFQVLGIGIPVVVVLNMVDLAESRGMSIDTVALSKKLGGISVIKTIGSKGKGIDELKQVVVKTLSNNQRPIPHYYDSFTRERLERISNGYNHNNGERNYALYARILFDEGGPAERDFLKQGGENEQVILHQSREELRSKFGTLSAAETVGLMSHASRICDNVVDKKDVKQSFSQKIDSVVLNPYLGPLILLTLLVLIFQSIFSWSEPLMNIIDGFFGFLSGSVASLMTDGPLESLITNGIIGGVGSVLVFLPQIVILFLFIAILEDSGYLPRAAFIVDRLFSWCGLSGKSLIPMLSSFACAVPGILATRTIEDRKIRFMTIMILPLMSCSARLPVYTIMIAAFLPSISYFGPFNLRGMVLTALYLLGLIIAVVASFTFNKLANKKSRGSFMMELPTYKWPTLQSIGIRVMHRARLFLLRAGTVILAITIVIWALSYYPHDASIGADYVNKQSQLISEHQSQLADEFTLSETDIQQLETMFIKQQIVLRQEEAGAYLSNSYFGRIGRAVQPLFAPLGWDWKITMATLASFPAREVIIATLGTIYNLGGDVDEGSVPLMEKMRQERWPDGPRAGAPIFTPAVALSIMVFFALCAQCAATLVTIRQETGSIVYPVISFVSMTLLAYGASFIVFQAASRLGL